MRPARNEARKLPLCKCDSIEPVYSEGGEVLARRCRLCVTIVSYRGTCDQCRMDAQLPVAHNALKKRFCSSACVQNYKAQEAKKRVEARGKEGARK